MRFHALDLLSDSPKNYIFQREANKTNFGGILTILFFVSFIFISILYILDYFDSIKNGEFIIEYLHINNNRLDIDVDKMNDNSKMNPNKTFYIQIYDSRDNYLSNNFVIYDLNEEQFLKKPENNIYIIEKRLSDINLWMLYNCSKEKNCSLKNEDKYLSSLYIFSIKFAIPNITHQDPSAPINEYIGPNKRLYHGEYMQSSFNSFHVYSLDWEKTIYREESTLFDRFNDKKNEYEYWDIGERRQNAYDDSYSRMKYDDNYYYKKLLQLSSFNEHSSYVSYKRKRITFLDTFVKLSSLFPTLFHIFQLIFNYYSKNFNNYKIIEKVLQMNTKSYRYLKLNNILYKNEIINYENKENNIDKDLDDDINNIDSNDNSRKSSLIITENNSEINNEEDELLQMKIMPKFSFIQFFCNNLYCNCCNKFRKQEFLYICNQIMLKYLSIDSILYYQMELENILKDYKWNNPILKNIEKNVLIKKLKNI